MARACRPRFGDVRGDLERFMSSGTGASQILVSLIGAVTGDWSFKFSGTAKVRLRKLMCGVAPAGDRLSDFAPEVADGFCAIAGPHLHIFAERRPPGAVDRRTASPA